jgi:hypothetical protein
VSDVIKDWLRQMADERASAGMDPMPHNVGCTCGDCPDESPKDPTVEMILPTDDGDVRIPVHIAHRYVRNETANFGGGNHVVVDLGFRAGRLERKRGQTLCLWSKKSRTGVFDAVEATRKPTCKKCLEVLKKLGASLEVTV